VTRALRFVLACALAVAPAACANGPSGGAAATGACDDARFARDRSAFTAGTLSGDQPEDVCGTVTRVRRARETRSGAHGYFDVRLPAGGTVEVIANLDAMARTRTDAPPGWPWVAPGDAVEVRGRYFFDAPGRDGIDWVEGDVGRSWPYPGFVTVCTANRTRCATYR